MKLRNFIRPLAIAGVFSFLTGSLHPSPILAQPYPPRPGVMRSVLLPPFRYADLLQLIQRHNPSSIDELLRLIPESYRRYYTLMHHSESAQPASAEFPRIIFYGPDARLMIAVTGNPNTPEGRQMEVIEQTGPPSFEFRPHLIEIAQGGQFTSPPPDEAPHQRLGRNARVTENPTSCTPCHGDPFHANFHGYNLWPGAFGSLSRLNQDRIIVGSPEHRAYQTFQRSIRTNPGRYRALPSPVPALRIPSNQIGFTNGAVTDPNAFLTQLLAERNAERIAALLLRHPLYDRFEYLLRAIMVNCFSAEHMDVRSFLPPLPPSIRRNPGFDLEAVILGYRELTLRDLQRSFGRQSGFQTVPEDRDPAPAAFDLGCDSGRCTGQALRGASYRFNPAFRSFYDNAPLLTYVLGLMGIPARQYVTERGARTLRLATPDTGLLHLLFNTLEHQRLARGWGCNDLASRSRAALAPIIGQLRPVPVPTSPSPAPAPAPRPGATGGTNTPERGTSAE